MKDDAVKRVRKLNQRYAYTSLQMHEAIAQKAGLTGTDHKYLGFLLERGAMTAGELAVLSGLTTGAITGLVDRFEKKKLVKRRVAADDRRKVMIEPNTEKIMAIFEPLYREFRARSEALTASFTTREVKIIETYLAKGIEIMDEITNDLKTKRS
jgi:DNA-binding MarR family transcriptional regulator